MMMRYHLPLHKITAPEVTHFDAFAQSLGCIPQAGVDMSNYVKDLMVNFFTEEPT
jgi:hypothetical protein